MPNPFRFLFRVKIKSEVEPVETEVQKFEKKHYGHILVYKHTPTGIGTAIDARCQTCHTKYKNVTEYGSW